MEISSFISRFHTGNSVEDVFTGGCCYWFAQILADRFDIYNAEIVYFPVENHFATKISGRIYDITGDITDKGGDWVLWSEFGDIAEAERIIRDCIMF